MASRGRKPFDRSGFRNQAKEAKDSASALQAILKQSRQSGQLNLSNRSLTEGLLLSGVSSCVHVCLFEFCL